MIDKITYDNGRIRSGFDTFNCDNDADMEVLCNNVNSMLMANAIKIHKMETKLMLIASALALNEEIKLVKMH